MFSSDGARNGRASDTPGIPFRRTRLAADAAESGLRAPFPPEPRERRGASVGFGVPSADESASALVSASFDAGAPTTSFRPGPKVSEPWLDPSAPRWPQPPAKRSGTDAARRLLQIDAKPEHTRERSVTPPAAGSRPDCGWPSRPAGGERKSKPSERRSRRFARACAWLRGGPNEPTTSTSRRNVPRWQLFGAQRYRSPCQDRPRADARTCEPEGEAEVPSSRWKPEPKPRLSFRPDGRTKRIFRCRPRVPSTARARENGGEHDPG